MTTAPDQPCPLCGGACTESNLAPLLNPNLRWLFEQIAGTADRRGDPALVTGQLRVQVCSDPVGRSAATGLLGGRQLRPGQGITIELSTLTERLRTRGPALTPGAAAAHAVGRPLAVKARARAITDELTTVLRRDFLEQHERLLADAQVCDLPRDAGQLLGQDGTNVWERMRRTGSVGRLRASEHPRRLLVQATAVLAHLIRSPASTDRRMLAQNAAGDPHALDAGSPLAGLVLAILTAAGSVNPSPRSRDAFRQVGVTGDDALGGLLLVGLTPAGWYVPDGTLLAMPPRELERLHWPIPPHPGAWVFVTENPSIASAAADQDALTTRPASPLVCTSGTPSALEIQALARLSAQGWRIAVRADFDNAGLGHVRALLHGIPNSVPWRMDTGHYLRSLQGPWQTGARLRDMTDDAAPWDPRLVPTMREHGSAGYEEGLLPLLLADRVNEASPPP